MNQNATPAEHPDHPPERAQALLQAEGLQDEAQATDFLLQCAWPDARLKAADLIHSRPLLEHALAAVRNSDRRVEKLLQQRLDALFEREAATGRGQRAIEQAQALVNATPLLVSQVADLDRQWSQVGDAPAAVEQEFAALREQLRQRLDAQTQLQLAVMELSGQLQQLIADTEPGSGKPLEPERVVIALDRLEENMAALCAGAEAASLPKRVLAEFRQKHQDLRAALGTLHDRHAAIVTRADLLQSWEAQEPAALNEASLREQWQALPALLPEDASGLSERFETLLARLEESRRATSRGSDEQRRQSRQQFSQAMDAMEAALQKGSLHEAAEQEHKLRDMDLGIARLRGDQKVRLQNARAELGRLQGWAKWGGKMSRDELLKSAQELPSRDLPVGELSREVGSLRERWKALDATAGAASKEAWQRFDAACTTAYAPAAEHFKKLSQERQDNLVRARALIDEVRRQADQLEQREHPGQVLPEAQQPQQGGEVGHVKDGENGVNGEEIAQVHTDHKSEGGPLPDWKAIAGFCDRLQQQWRRLGPIDRKPSKLLDTEFAEAMQRLTKPLSLQQAAEKEERERLIKAVEEIDSSQRRAPELLAQLQQRWQQRARQLPLMRNDEHALWQRFRSACDQLFARRKQHVKSADAERTSHLREREALCERLEAAHKEKSEVVRNLMREAKSSWTRMGQVPRSAERQIESRFQRAMLALQKQLEQGERSARQVRGEQLAQRFGLCLHIERLLVSGNGDLDAATLEQLRAQWNALAPAGTALDKALATRFDAGLSALACHDADRIRALQDNLPLLAHELLRAEITLGMESPPGFARERLQVQVEVLQSSLKSGEKTLAPQGVLLRLASLPAPLDEQGEGRLRAIVARLA